MKDSSPKPPVPAAVNRTLRIDPPPAPAIAPLAPRYDILAEIGVGGMGRVYQARDRETNEIIALKVLRPEVAVDPGMAERFKNELRLARRITHKNVCRIYEFHRADDIAYITMEYVDGESLRARLKHSAPLALARAAELAAQICAGLREAHAQGIVHRDLKPENIMIARDGLVKIMDFGIARSVESLATATGALLGTPAYMAPEQAYGKPVDQRADIYALGLILYECITGRRAFSGDTPIEVALKQVNERPLAPRRIDAKIPVHVEATILRCLEKDPARRFARVEQIESALMGRTVAAAPVPAATAVEPAPSARRGAVPWLVLLAAAAGGTVIWHNMNTSPAPVVTAPIEDKIAITIPPQAPIAAPAPPTSAPQSVETIRTPERGRSTDLEKLLAAAETGRPQAQFRLAQVLTFGPPALRDEAKGAQWMRRAAEQGYAEAQFALGKMYEKGRGVERNPPLARTWYERAAAGGHDEARELLKRSSERRGPRR